MELALTTVRRATGHRGPGWTEDRQTADPTEVEGYQAFHGGPPRNDGGARASVRQRRSSQPRPAPRTTPFGPEPPETRSHSRRAVVDGGRRVGRGQRPA